MSRTVNLAVLDDLRVASPCSARWEDMAGDERVRFCSGCRLHVYDLSAMTRAEAAELVASVSGRLCVRFYRRADGTVLTRDCPVGLRAVRARIVAGLSRAGAAAAFLFGSMVALGAGGVPGAVRLRQLQPFAAICEWLSPKPVPLIPSGGLYIMGDVLSPIPSCGNAPPTGGPASPGPLSITPPGLAPSPGTLP